MNPSDFTYIHRGFGEHIKGDHKGHSKYFAVWRPLGKKKSKQLGIILTRNAKEMRTSVLKYLETSGNNNILITVYASHDNGFSDPYEFFCKTDDGIFRCFYNQLNKKQDQGDYAALQIGKFVNPDRQQRS